ncbi:MAG: DUF2971 domain-containing protein [Gammaproteobacteria bacterium]|nr:DUF2971 domain-containing protein [Gammaproteobacteria bacterium]
MEHPDVTKLYKYRTFSPRSLGMLANNRVYFAASFAFNDPFDCRARREFEFSSTEDFVKKMTPLESSHEKIPIPEAIDRLQQIASDSASYSSYLEKKSQLFQKLAMEQFGIYTMSETPLDILMWSHYADGHTGFCIEFRRKPGNILEFARKVEYPEDDEFPLVDYFLGKTEEQIEEFAKIVLTKSKHWCYEREWRALDAPKDVEGRYKGHEKEYDDDEMLSGIIFGLRMPEKNRQVIRKLLSEKNVSYYDAKMVKNKFQIEIAPT